MQILLVRLGLWSVRVRIEVEGFDFVSLAYTMDFLQRFPEETRLKI